MSNLQLTCPKCSQQIIIRRPSAKRATVRCSGCGNAFTFNVPAPQAPAPDPLFMDFAGGSRHGPSAPSSPTPLPPGGVPGRPSVHSVHGVASVRGATRGSTTGKHTGQWIAPVLIGTCLLFGTAVSGVGVWMLLAKSSILPSTVALFDSPRSILETAGSNDLELQRLVGGLSTSAVSPETRTKIEELTVESMRLIARAVRLDPLSEDEARGLSGVGGGDEASRDGPAGPLNETDMESMHSKLNELPESDRMIMRAMVSAALKSNSFVREYLRCGHLELPASGTPGEQIKVKQIELLRELNQLGANVVMKIEPDFSDQPKSEEEVQSFLDGIYGPIVDDVAALAERMHALAATRYRIPKDQVGDPDQFDEIMYYTQKAQGSVLVANLALIRSKAKIVEPLSEFLTASKDVDRAAVGLQPKRLAAAEEEQQRREGERLRKEQDRKERIARQARELDQQLQQEKQQAELNRDKLAMAQGTSDERTADQHVDDSASSAPGFGPRFGPRFGPGGMSDSRPSSRFGPQFGPPSGFGNRGSAQPPRDGRPTRPSGPRRAPTAPFIEPGTGVTITMDDTSSIDTSTLPKKFLEALNVGVQSTVSNGKLTLRLAYEGPLVNVIELIDFGRVISSDEPTRTIKVVAE